MVLRGMVKDFVQRPFEFVWPLKAVCNPVAKYTWTTIRCGPAKPACAVRVSRVPIRMTPYFTEVDKKEAMAGGGGIGVLVAVAVAVLVAVAGTGVLVGVAVAVAGTGVPVAVATDEAVGKGVNVAVGRATRAATPLRS